MIERSANKSQGKLSVKAMPKAITKEVVGVSNQRQNKWDLLLVIGSILAAIALIFMFMNIKIEAVNASIDSLEKNSEFKAKIRASNQRILDKLDRLEQSQSNIS